MNHPANFKDLTKKTFGYLKVLNKNKYSNNHLYWLCKCVCNKTKWIRADALIRGDIKSCGCKTGELMRKAHLGKYGERAKRDCYQSYIRGAKTRKIYFNLSFKQFTKLTQKPCYYCGQNPNSIQKSKVNNGNYIYNGLDRVNNEKGYIISNVVPCCKICNQAKHSMSKTQFLKWIDKVYLFNRFKGKHKKWSMLLGRYQCLPPHSGHQGLVRQLLKENKNVLIVLRKEDKTNKNPYSFKERKQAFTKIFRKEIKNGKVKIVELEDIIEVVYGRTPGWGIREIRLNKDIESISATKIREKNANKENKA